MLGQQVARPARRLASNAADLVRLGTKHACSREQELKRVNVTPLVDSPRIDGEEGSR